MSEKLLNASTKDSIRIKKVMGEPHILETILKNLNKKDRRNAALVDRLWYKTITNIENIKTPYPLKIQVCRRSL